MDLSIIPECNIDTNLIETLVPPITRYNHQKGCGTVAKTMKTAFADKFAVGIIDKDKTELDYLREFDLIIQKGNLELYRHNTATKHHYFIRICPAMERFIILNADAAGLSLIDFGLDEDFELFKKTTKTVVSKNDRRFKKLFQAFIQHGLEDVILITNWLVYLKNHPYSANSTVLRDM
jgi:hypothetical protein